MISAELMTFLSAISILLSAMMLGLWQILSAPDRPNYPTSGRFKRTMMFILVVMLSGRGVELLTSLAGPAPVLSTPFQSASSFALCALFASFLVDHLRNWLPARTHHNIQRLYRIARCSAPKTSPGARASSVIAAAATTLENAPPVETAVRDLALSGVRVSRPNEGPEAFTKTPR